jgi:hypothetical protein
MSVSAISAAALLPLLDMGGLLATETGSTAFDFANLLAAVQMPGIADGDSALKTEASRSVSVVGHVQTTVIHFIDGTSETRSVATGEERLDVPPLAWVPPFMPQLQPSAPAIKANSDLEPEQGLRLERRPLNWGTKSGLAGLRQGAGRAIAAPGASSAPEDGDLGRLIDVVG